MSWASVGAWLKDNAGSGAALIGSLLTGNIPGAIAAGASMVSSVTGTDNPEKALAALKNDPAILLKLKELALKEEENIREHLRAMTELTLQDAQAEQHETQETIRSGDNAEDSFVRRTRPGQSWLSLVAALAYVAFNVHAKTEIDTTVLGLLLTLPWTYAGLRQIGKGVDALKRK